ncbi:MAG: CHAP domain-containing protein [Pseudomonas sp.]|uniref:CHAP domain-containing protein n=1 Tax=Pseudomonas sp. TaxID=306 RepID=UPI002733D0CD|nr:CHAP domain-containing protein [Pseudomonas sp.]MDP3847708.1 CHAP domain-containing protein [Pseudomonas sp.]
MNKHRLILVAACALLLPLITLVLHAAVTRINPNDQHVVGDPLDELNGVVIYYNGGVNTTRGRNLSSDGYNLGMRYQCVEFVKRYYFERYDHRMPDTFGHAKDFFDSLLADSELNSKRAMRQFTNGSAEQPQPDDLLVFGPWLFNRYGHVAIIARIDAASIEIAQQNPGPYGSSREHLPLVQREGRWFIEHPRVLGWLRLQPAESLPSE